MNKAIILGVVTLVAVLAIYFMQQDKQVNKDVADVAKTGSEQIQVAVEPVKKPEIDHPNWRAGEQFLAENASKEGVVTTASGLQYKVIREGAGRSPTTDDTVEVHYHGTVIDGTVFDSSVDRGETIAFRLNQVIKGWIEGLQLMKEGGKTVLYIPSDLAYGSDQKTDVITPYSTLIFEVELFKVNP